MYLMIGVSGSGKTTWIRNHLKNSTVCSADHYFTDQHGNYHFDGSKIVQAHEYCFNKAKMAVNAKDACIVIDNQNLLESQRKRYEELACNNGYAVVYVCFKSLSAKVLAERCVHGLSEKKIQSYVNNIQYPKSGEMIWITAESLLNNKEKE